MIWAIESSALNTQRLSISKVRHTPLARKTHSRIGSRSAQFAIFGPYIASRSYSAIRDLRFEANFPKNFLRIQFVLEMDYFFRARMADGMPLHERLIDQGVELCPFLRNITEPTNFCFASPIRFPTPVEGVRGPIFEDGPNFDTAFRLFHGHNGVVPLSGRSSVRVNPETLSATENAPTSEFHPFAASAATISLSAFGAGGPFSFDAFMGRNKNIKRNKKKGEPNGKKKEESNGKKKPNLRKEDGLHETTGKEWLETGQCPIAKSYQAVSKVLPLVANLMQPPPGMKVKCPPAIVAARAALARTAFVKNLRPKSLPEKMFAIGLLGMAANIPLGVWREHTEKFSPSWFIAIHSAIPFVAMLRKAVNMPKTAMAVTIAASILGQVIGSRAEKARLKQAENMPNVEFSTCEHLNAASESMIPARVYASNDESLLNSQCGVEIWDTSERTQPSSDTLRAC